MLLPWFHYTVLYCIHVFSYHIGFLNMCILCQLKFFDLQVGISCFKEGPTDNMGRKASVFCNASSDGTTDSWMENFGRFITWTQQRLPRARTWMWSLHFRNTMATFVSFPFWCNTRAKYGISNCIYNEDSQKSLSKCLK